MNDHFVKFGGIYAFGSNCLHHALVAHGGSGAVGAITTCCGGPHDIAAGLLVLEAGGAVRSFSNRSGELVEVAPLDVLEANFMVSGNSCETVNRLAQLLMYVS
jgi:fructose-1,6-bisphosphatase/inositol monophosphatase family enzyme